MFDLARRLWHDDHGAEMVEWAVVVVILLSASVAVLFGKLQPLVIKTIVDTFADMQKAPPRGF